MESKSRVSDHAGYPGPRACDGRSSVTGPSNFNAKRPVEQGIDSWYGTAPEGAASAREKKKKKASDNLAKRGEKGGISMFLQG